jgi:general secretion pathway protein A
VYTDFYGLKEKPFALLPDPRFIYLGNSHREALAHLLYGIEEGEGFIKVVGQVGTGKTTLCRTLLERVPEDAEIAYIFNPSRSETELLAAINREFGLPTAARSRNDLIEQLNTYLLEQKAQSKKPILIIDEAQNLEPEVLEQIRLLSNLETDREKLLQIVLIGQPELEEKLARSDMRQLRQRITVRWDLSPFDATEVAEYVSHRLRVAGLHPHVELFSPSALRALHRASRGIPRLVNAIADRVMLLGYAEGTAKFTAKDVRRAARELPDTGRRAVASIGLGLAPWTAIALVAAGLIIGFASAPLLPIAEETAGPAGVSAMPPRTFADGSIEDLQGHLLEQSSRVTAAGALAALLDVWGYPEPVGDEVDPNMLASVVRGRAGLRVFVTRATRGQLVALNLPAVLELEPEPDRHRYLALTEFHPDGHATFASRDQVFELDFAQIERMWTGRTFFLWTNFESVPALSPGMKGSAVRWLQARLTELGYLQRGDASGDFDGHTAAAIRRFQVELSLDDTGELGPETLIALYQALRYGAPRLWLTGDVEDVG